MNPTIHITFQLPPPIQIRFPAYVQVPVEAGEDGSGTDGDDGWAPILAVVSDSARRVLQVTDWTGGTGTKPATGQYLGASGLVSTAAEAVDVRGVAGADGPAGATGAAGANGSDGAAGADGADGEDGAAGSVWHSGTGAPSNGTGVVGDRYINTANGDHYEKTGDRRGPCVATSPDRLDQRDRPGPQARQGPLDRPDQTRSPRRRRRTSLAF